jgi:hypothetical protein
VYAAAQSRQRIGSSCEKVRVRVDSVPESVFEGTIERIAGAVDPAKGSLQVFARIANPEQRLRPGMRATISVVTDTAGLAITVPKGALLGEFGSTFVFVQEKDPLTFEAHVQLGLATIAVRDREGFVGRSSCRELPAPVRRAVRLRRGMKGPPPAAHRPRPAKPGCWADWRVTRARSSGASSIPKAEQTRQR